MFHFLSQHRVLLLVLLLVLIGLHLLSSGLKHKTNLGFVGKSVLFVYTPIYKVLSWPFQKAAWLASNYLYLVEVKDLNGRLRKQNGLLKGQLSRFAELEAENHRLLALLGLRDTEVKPVAYARVVGRSLTPEFRTLIIDVGSSQGVKTGMAVVTAEGLIGFVAVVVPHSAKVVLITDASARVDTIVQRTRGQAMVFGRGKKHCSLEYLTDPDVVVGDRVITSGVGGLFPKGVPVGVVAAVNRGQPNSPQGIWVLPSADLDSVEEVAVLPSIPVGEPTATGVPR